MKSVKTLTKAQLFPLLETLMKIKVNCIIDYGMLVTKSNEPYLHILVAYDDMGRCVDIYEDLSVYVYTNFAPGSLLHDIPGKEEFKTMLKGELNV